MLHKPIRMVIIRHGESIWNKANRYTGWEDVPLTENGKNEMRQAAKWVADYGIKFDIAYTSCLKRSIQSFNILNEGTDSFHLPLIKSWRLNERHYGSLQGMCKSDMVKLYGAKQMELWTRSYLEGPPPLSREEMDKFYADSKYSMVPRDMIPATESMRDTEIRVRPVWDEIGNSLLEGYNILICAHGNSLRTLVRAITGVHEDGIYIT